MIQLELAKSAAGRVVLLQILSIHDGAVGVTDLGVMLLWIQHLNLYEIQHIYIINPDI